MGLDMYLNVRISGPSGWANADAPLTAEFTTITEQLRKQFPFIDRVTECIVPLYYWRKENWIHKWFVDNVQQGEDDCKKYTFWIPELEKLLTTIKEVLDDHSLAESKLPPQSGFFFGGTEVNEEYFDCLQRTYNDLSAKMPDLLKAHAEFGWDVLLEYQSSW